MLKVYLDAARPGMTLALPVHHPRYPQRPLLRVGYALDDLSIERMGQLGVGHVWVRYPSLEYIERYIEAEVMEQQGQLVGRITQAFEQSQSQSVARLPYEMYCKQIGTMIRNLVSHPKAAVFMGDLMNAAPAGECEADEVRRSRLMRHSSAVAYLSVLMGLKLEGYLVRQRRHVDPARAKEITNLGLGAMLHDWGVTRLPDDVRRRYEHSEDENDPQWRRHPLLGYEELRGQVEPSAATCVLHHHQRFDGSGYCGSEDLVLEGERIHVFARIVGLAEQFDCMRHPEIGRPRPTVSVLSQLLHRRFIESFDREVLRALFSVTPPYPPGSIVRLSNGEQAVVLDHHPTDPCRPTVQVIPPLEEFDEEDDTPGEQYDLSQDHWHLHITECDGEDVTKYTFAAPEFLMGFTRRQSA